MHKNLRDLKITPDTCTEKCTKIAQGMKHYVISSSEKKMVLVESRHLRIKIKNIFCKDYFLIGVIYIDKNSVYTYLYYAYLFAKLL